MAKRKDVTERKSLNKQEKETLREINKKFKKKKKRFHLTAKRYLEFLKNLNKANKKLEKLSNKKGWLGGKTKISPKIENATDEEQLERMLQRPDEVLSPEYEKSVNDWYKSQFVKNIEDAFGDSLGAENLTEEQIDDLIKRNPHLSFLLHYHRGMELAENIGLFGVTEDDMEQAIREECDFYEDYDI